MGYIFCFAVGVLFGIFIMVLMEQAQYGDEEEDDEDDDEDYEDGE